MVYPINVYNYNLSVKIFLKDKLKEGVMFFSRQPCKFPLSLQPPTIPWMGNHFFVAYDLNILWISEALPEESFRLS